MALTQLRRKAMSSMVMQSDDEYFYRNVINKIKDQTVTGKAPWLNSTTPKNKDVSFNPVTGMLYNGITGLYLDMVSTERGYKDPRWLSAHEVQEGVASGKLQIKYGEKPVLVAYHNKYQHGNDIDPISGEAVKNMEAPRYYYVYNGEQLKGLRSIELGQETEYHSQKQEIIKNNTGMDYKEVPEHITAKSFEKKDPNLASTMAAIALYRYSIAMHLSYTPTIDKNTSIQELRGRTGEEILKGAYFAENAKSRLLSHGQRLENPVQQRPAELDRQRRSIEPLSR